ncbi:MAG: glycosyltransferase [Luteimonas sp.]
MYLTPRSLPVHNPWRETSVAVEAAWSPDSAAALFLGGEDWSAHPADDPGRPVINLVQHVRHADPADTLHRHLSRRAVRICVSQAVADAIAGTGRVNGPVRVIPAALDMAKFPACEGLREGVFIGASKQPALGRSLYDCLRAQGRDATLVDTWQPRATFLAHLARCRVAVMLPAATEGFFLPGLEAMALGCATVVPDCVGNREYLRPGLNVLAPAAELDALARAVADLDDQQLASRLSEAGRTTATTFGLERERSAFHAVLDELDALWRT